MKKIFTILCLMALTMGAQAQAPYKGIQLTFDKDGSGNASPDNVAVVVKNMDGNTIDGVTATLTTTNFNAFLNSGQTAITRSENFAVVPAPQSGYGNGNNSPIEYTITISGISSEFAYTTAAIDVYAANSAGNSQPNSGNTVRPFDFLVQTGSTAANLADFAASAGNDVCTVSDQDGGLFHKLWVLPEASTATITGTTTLVVKVILTKKIADGCFAGLGKVQLYDDTPETVTEYDAIRLTFDKKGSGSSPTSNVDVKVTNLEGTLISGVNATLTKFETSMGSAANIVDVTNFLTAGSTAAITSTKNFVLAPSSYFNNQGAVIRYTFKIDGLDNFSYSKAQLDGYTVTAVGDANPNAYPYTYTVETSTDGTNWSNFNTPTTGNIIGDGTAVDGLRHKVLEMMATENKTSTDPLYVRVSLTREGGGGQYAGIRGLDLSFVDLSSMVTVTYELLENETKVTSIDVQQPANSEVSVPTELTSGYYADAYTFPTSGTIGTEDCTITVTATPNTGVVTDLDNLSNDKVYTLVTRRGALSTDGSAVTTNTSGGTPRFGIVKYGSDYYLWSVNDSKWVKNDGTLTDNVADIATNSKLVVTADGVRNNLKPLFFMGVGNNGLNTNAGGHCAVNDFTTRDDGNEFVITENGSATNDAYAALDAYFNPAYTITYVVKEGSKTLFTSDPIGTTPGASITTLPTEFQRPLFYTYNSIDLTISETETIAEFEATPREDVPVQFTEDATNPIYYNAKIRGKYLMYDSSVTDELKLQDTSEPFNHNAAWAFVGDPYKGFNVINQAKGANSVLTYTSVTTSKPANHNIQFQTGAEAEAKTWLIETNNCAEYPGGIVLRMKESTNIYFHHENSQNYLRTCSKEEWSDVHDDKGSTIILTTDEAVLISLRDALAAMEFGTGLNQYSKPSDYDNVMAAANTVIANEQVADYETQYNALKALQASLTLNMPQAGFFRIKGKTSSKYIAAGMAGGTYAMSDATDGTTIFYYNGSKLVNYSTGAGVDAGNWAWTTTGFDGAATIAFEDGLTNGGYAVKSGDVYLYDRGDEETSRVDRGGIAIDANTNVRYTSWYLEEVPTLPITLRTTDNTNYFATFSAPVPVGIEGATLCSVSSNSNKWIQYEEKPATQLAAGTGVLLHATGSGEETIEATATILTETEATDTYGLEGYSAAFTVETGDKTMLFLGKGKDSGKVGFYALGSAKTNGFKAYFDNPSGESGEAKEGFDLVDANETTGVESIDNSQFAIDNAPVYNLQGQRVNKAQKGVFIQNGKKVVVK